MDPKAVSTILSTTIPNPKSFAARAYLRPSSPVLPPPSRSQILKSLLLQTSKRYELLGKTDKNKEYIKRAELLRDEIVGTDVEGLRVYTERRERKIRKGKVRDSGRWCN